MIGGEWCAFRWGTSPGTGPAPPREGEFPDRSSSLHAPRAGGGRVALQPDHRHYRRLVLVAAFVEQLLRAGRIELGLAQAAIVIGIGRAHGFGAEAGHAAILNCGL